MANISITSACNRNCCYCFAGKADGPKGIEGRHMGLEEFDRALEFLERSGMDQVRLLGGEPTLHPDFELIVDKVLERGHKLLLFSNGLMPEPVTQCLEMLPREGVTILINTALPDESPEDHQRQQAVFERLGDRIIPGLNIYSPEVRLTFLLDLIREYGLLPVVRLGLAHPCVDYDNQYLKPRHYQSVGRNIAGFARRAYSEGVSIDFDCGFVPCMFSEDMPEEIKNSMGDIGSRCNPVIDILSDGTVSPCYPLCGTQNIPFDYSCDAAIVSALFEEGLRPFRQIGLFRECTICGLKKTGACNGGCLAAAMKRFRSQPFSLRLETTADIRDCRIGCTEKKKRVCADKEMATGESLQSKKIWAIPYVDQPISFWRQLEDRFGAFIKEVYFPIPTDIAGSGRPPQPSQYLEDFLGKTVLEKSVLINPITLPCPVDEIGPVIIDELNELSGNYGISGATVANLGLAGRIRKAIPGLSLTASVLMDVSTPQQAIGCNGIFDSLVPSSRIMRDIQALKELKDSFGGRIRLIVNEACLPGCLFRTQHFHEMAGGFSDPSSLCNELLSQHPWLRLTGAWVLPQHLHFYDSVYDELKLAGRVTLRDPADYIRVLDGYAHRRVMRPHEIGGGPASIVLPLDIQEEFFSKTLYCRHQCHNCLVCKDYYDLRRPEYELVDEA
jgi:hypothetical protein